MCPVMYIFTMKGQVKSSQRKLAWESPVMAVLYIAANAMPDVIDNSTKVNAAFVERMKNFGAREKQNRRQLNRKVRPAFQLRSRGEYPTSFCETACFAITDAR